MVNITLYDIISRKGKYHVDLLNSHNGYI